jgi:hypothetical protein
VGILVDIVEAPRGRRARAEIPHHGGLRAGALVLLGQELAAARADARIEVPAEQDVLVDLVRVLDVLDAEERARTPDRHRDAEDEASLLAQLRAAHGPRRGEAREDQDGGVDRAVLHVQVLVRVRIDLGVVVAIQDVRDEQRREEQHLLGEEDPDPELARVELVLGVVVVVLDERRAVAVAMPVIGMAVVVAVRGVWLIGHLSSSPGGMVGGTGSPSARKPLAGWTVTGSVGGTGGTASCAAGDASGPASVPCDAVALAVAAFGDRRSQTSSSTSTRSS